MINFSRGHAGYTLSGEIDLGTMTFSSEATWPGKSVKLTTHYENGLLVNFIIIKKTLYLTQNVNHRRLVIAAMLKSHLIVFSTFFQSC